MIVCECDLFGSQRQVVVYPESMTVVNGIILIRMTPVDYPLLSGIIDFSSLEAKDEQTRLSLEAIIMDFVARLNRAA